MRPFIVSLSVALNIIWIGWLFLDGVEALRKQAVEKEKNLSTIHHNIFSAFARLGRIESQLEELEQKVVRNQASMGVKGVRCHK